MCLDVCGLAANLYRRNTPVIKVPPSLHRPLELHAIPMLQWPDTCLPQASRSGQCYCWCSTLPVLLKAHYGLSTRCHAGTVH